MLLLLYLMVTHVSVGCHFFQVNASYSANYSHVTTSHLHYYNSNGFSTTNNVLPQAKPVIFSIYSHHFSGTNPDFTYIFSGPTPLFFFHQGICMYGLGPDRLMHTKSISTLVYTFIVGLHRILRFFNLTILKHTLRHRCGDTLIILGNARKRRKYVAAMKYRAHLTSAAAFVLLLLLCGDVHPNPGPVLSGSTRHPNAQHLVVGSWNVRTLVESRRTKFRPSAIVARELDRYGIDIAALSETRVLDSYNFEEPGSGYTFFLKGKAIGEKHYHGVGFAIRTKYVSHLVTEYWIP